MSEEGNWLIHGAHDGDYHVVGSGEADLACWITHIPGPHGKRLVVRALLAVFGRRRGIWIACSP